MAWRRPRSDPREHVNDTSMLSDGLARIARPLETGRDLGPLLDLIGDARFVLLGEATHGTSEFYTWRTEISKRLIQERGFSFIAVEGDWPDCYRVNRYVKAMERSGGSAEAVLHAFERWPTWMWANREVIDLVDWMRAYNHSRDTERRVGFYGLDVYSLWDSMRGVTEFLQRVDPELAAAAKRAYRCFEPYAEDVQEYARATALVPTSCEDEAVSVLRDLRANAPQFADDGRESFFNAEQNALVAKNAEKYYRAMYRGRPNTWNLRDTHMVETLDSVARFLERSGDKARVVVWAHNSHLGDARATQMGRSGELNVGQLARERFGEEACLIGFTTYSGTVTAAHDWDEPAHRRTVRPGLAGSTEALFHRVGDPRFLLDLRNPDVRDELSGSRLERAIGVIYRPETERQSHYFHVDLPRQFDVVIHFDETRALERLERSEGWVAGEPPETYPFAV